MSQWLIWLTAAVSIAICFWFRSVRRIMRQQRSAVENAATQLAFYRKKAVGVRYDPELAEVLMRSENIYRQAVKSYHKTLRNPRMRLPAILMGFRSIPREKYTVEHDENSKRKAAR